MSVQPNIAVIGAGSAKGQDYLQALVARGQGARIGAIVINKQLPEEVEKWAQKYSWKVIRDGNIEELIKSCSFDTAFVALPHDQHDAVARRLLAQNVYMIKEKPLGMSLKDVQAYQKLIREKKVKPIFTTLQRSTHPLFLQAKADLKEIGKLRTFSYTYTFNLPNPTSGWRADPAKSGGGVVLDMGYHALDVLMDFFGYPEKIRCAFGYKYPEMAKNRLEDSAKIAFTYYSTGLTGSLLLNRHSTAKDERFTIVGAQGKMVITPTSYELYKGDAVVKHETLQLSKIDIIQKMLDVCLGPNIDLESQFERNMNTMRLIDTIYSQKSL